MLRISVVGSTGSGKSTAARSIADKLSYPHLELDSVYHQPGWEPLPDNEFRAVAGNFADQAHWVIDGNYMSQGVLDVVWQAADTVIWLDPPKRTVMRRIVWRSASRALTREELWNGNRERWSSLFKLDPEENIVRWAWTRFESRREILEERMNDPQWSHLDFIRLRSRGDVQSFINSLLPGRRVDG